MDEYYFKPDERKPWQKIKVLAILVLCLLYVYEAILNFLKYVFVTIWQPVRKVTKAHDFPEHEGYQ